MCSATWPEGVRRLAKQYMKDPVQVQVGSLDLTVSQLSIRILVVMQVNESILTDFMLIICCCNQWQSPLCLKESTYAKFAVYVGCTQCDSVG